MERPGPLRYRMEFGGSDGGQRRPEHLCSAGGSEHAVAVSGVQRSFGTAEALRGVDFTAAFGEVTGMVGPNGAGKTTLLLILATLLAPDQGLVRISGLDPMANTAEVRRLLGWVPDTFGFYENLTAHEYLAFSGEARGLPRKSAAERAATMLELVRMAEWADRPVHVLSRGQKQRLAFASALVHEPTVCCWTSRPQVSILQPSRVPAPRSNAG